MAKFEVYNVLASELEHFENGVHFCRAFSIPSLKRNYEIKTAHSEKFIKENIRFTIFMSHYFGLKTTFLALHMKLLHHASGHNKDVKSRQVAP